MGDRLGLFLAEEYKKSAGPNFNQAKYNKKINNMHKTSHVIAIICKYGKRPHVSEEMCAVAMSVHNMQLLLCNMRAAGLF